MLAVLAAMTLLATATVTTIPTLTKPAAADLIVPVVCTVDGQQIISLVPCDSIVPSFSPPDLLNIQTLSQGEYAATTAQAASLQDFEQAAVSDVLSDHGLPASDASAVQSWGRDAAEAELWALIVQAIQTPAATQTSDQQNVVAWLTAVAQRQAVQAADDAGLEYTKWAGLGTSFYQSLLTPTPSESALQTFLSGTPEPYTGTGSVTNPAGSTDGGYCVYIPPSPDQSDYTGGLGGSMEAQLCEEPSCQALLGCSPSTPTYDDFVQWGEAGSEGALFDTDGFAQTARQIATYATLAGASAGSAVAGFGLGSGLAGVLGGSALQEAIYPFAARALQSTINAAVQAAEAAGKAQRKRRPMWPRRPKTPPEPSRHRESA